MGYDVIGDVHGHADALRALLAKLGYEHRKGAWRHPEHRVIFLGDFIDRGSQQLETLRIVREMLDAGSALAVMGNHELNAIMWATPSPDGGDPWIRPHSNKNRAQHTRFLAEAGEESPAHREWITWFRQLPLWLETPELRVIHAAWIDEEVARIRPHLGARTTLTDDLLHQYANRTPLFDAVETVLKGVEVPLPEGSSFLDKDGHSRDAIRIKWWEGDASVYRDAALEEPAAGTAWSTQTLPEGVVQGHTGETPVFVGHYWLTGLPRLTDPKVACLDFSVAQAGVLCAYQWRGEAQLRPDRLVWVDSAGN